METNEEKYINKNLKNESQKIENELFFKYFIFTTDQITQTPMESSAFCEALYFIRALDYVRRKK